MKFREYLAELGYTKLDDIIGRTDLLMRKPSDHIEKHDLLDLSRLIHLPEQAATQTIHQVTRQLHAIDNVKDVDIIRHAKAAIESGQEVSLDYAIANTDRSVGAMLSGEIAKRYGNIGLPENTLHIKFKGAAARASGLSGSRRTFPVGRRGERLSRKRIEWRTHLLNASGTLHLYSGRQYDSR